MARRTHIGPGMNKTNRIASWRRGYRRDARATLATLAPWARMDVERASRIHSEILARRNIADANAQLATAVSVARSVRK